MTNGAGASDAINIEKVRSSGGKEGVVVVSKTSGAGTATDWHVLASVKNKILKLDPTETRHKVLKARGYVFMGYNGVTVNGDAVIESLSGYSRGRARCCPDRPSIAIKSRFTGTSIKLESVKKLPAQEGGTRGQIDVPSVFVSGQFLVIEFASRREGAFRSLPATD
jgi:hypothetical protein